MKKEKILLIILVVIVIIAIFAVCIINNAKVNDSKYAKNTENEIQGTDNDSDTDTNTEVILTKDNAIDFIKEAAKDQEGDEDYTKIDFTYGWEDENLYYFKYNDDDYTYYAIVSKEYKTVCFIKREIMTTGLSYNNIINYV